MDVPYLMYSAYMELHFKIRFINTLGNIMFLAKIIGCGRTSKQVKLRTGGRNIHDQSEQG